MHCQRWLIGVLIWANDHRKGQSVNQWDATVSWQKGCQRGHAKKVVSVVMPRKVVSVGVQGKLSAWQRNAKKDCECGHAKKDVSVAMQILAAHPAGPEMHT